MSKLISILLVTAIVLFGCCPTKTITVTETVIKDSLVYRDTTVYVQLPGDTVTDSVPFNVYIPGIDSPIPAHLINSDTLELKSILSISYTWVKGGYLHGIIQDKDTTLRVKLDSSVVEIYRLIEKNSIITQDNQKIEKKLGNYRTAFYTALFVSIFLLALVSLLFRAKLK